MEQSEIVYKLQKAKINLDKFPYDQLLQIINSMSLKDILAFRIPAGTMILRARPNTEVDFSCIDQISHPPNTNIYGRANRPGHPMFYGAITSNPSENYQDMMATLFAEILEIFKQKIITEGEKKLTIGRWFNDADLLVIGMIFNDNFLQEKPDFQGLCADYLTYLLRHKHNKYHLEILKLISNEFAKSVISNDNEYKISAAFVEAILNNSIYKLDGIVYPSVKCEGKYFNIALTPDCIKEKMELLNVFTTTVYYKEGFVINDYEKEAFLNIGEKDFFLSDICDDNLHFGKDKTLALLDDYIKNSKKIVVQ